MTNANSATTSSQNNALMNRDSLINAQENDPIKKNNNTNSEHMHITKTTSGTTATINISATPHTTLSNSTTNDNNNKHGNNNTIGTCKTSSRAH